MRPDVAGTLVVFVDLQERLLAAVPTAEAVVRRSVFLATAARMLGVRCLLTEQYPQGLGPTPRALSALLPPPHAKTAFSCMACAPLTAALDAAPAVRAVVLCGLETHVCIAQTALDLLARGLQVFIPVDAVASRHALDHDTALRRLECGGAIPTTAEAIVFEWLRDAAHPSFKDVQRLIREDARRSAPQA